MAKDIAKEIDQMLVEAWNKFLGYYNEKAPKYRESWPLELNEKGAKESHWVCWNEYDLMFHIGRFFYDILKGKTDGEFANIEVHFEKNVNSTNFKDYKFEGRLDELNEKLKMKKGPKVDVIVGYEDKNSPFLLCVEMKYFHSASERYQRTPIQKIRDDIRKLKSIRDCGIAERVVFMLFDDYYWITKEDIANDIKYELEKIKRDEKITVLFSSSEAKLRKISK
jgi:hypothetical protein